MLSGCVCVLEREDERERGLKPLPMMTRGRCADLRRDTALVTSAGSARLSGGGGQGDTCLVSG